MNCRSLAVQPCSIDTALTETKVKGAFSHVSVYSRLSRLSILCCKFIGGYSTGLHKIKTTVNAACKAKQFRRESHCLQHWNAWSSEKRTGSSRPSSSWHRRNGVTALSAIAKSTLSSNEAIVKYQHAGRFDYTATNKVTQKHETAWRTRSNMVTTLLTNRQKSISYQMKHPSSI